MGSTQLLRWYEAMLRIRRVEEWIGSRVEERLVAGPCHLCIGQEAVAVGVAEALEAKDSVWGAHRSHGHYLAKGGNLAGLLAEIMGLPSGCTGGRGGSMHLTSPDVGIAGTVPIVAGTIPLAVGAAFAAKRRGTGAVAVAFFGDGATEQGHFAESLNLAALYRLPVIFVCENNLYSSHLPLQHRQANPDLVPRVIAAGVPATAVDGNDVEAVFNAASAAVDRARAGEGPSLIEARTYRQRGHVGPAEDLHVGETRAAELTEWRLKDPIVRLRRRLVGEGLIGAVESMEASVRAEIDCAEMVCGGGGMRQTSYASAIRDGFAHLLRNDSDVVVFGQGVWSPWYVGSTMADLDREFGRDRVVDTPVSEHAVTGMAIGAAIGGLRPIVVHPRMDFMLLAADTIINQAANWRALFGTDVPVVIRAIVNRGGEQGAQHSQALQALFAHVPGLKVVMPATPADAQGLLISAVYDGDPVIYIDDRWLYDTMGDVPEAAVPVPIGQAMVTRRGEDVTVIATSWMASQALAAAETLAASAIDVEVVDLRTIKPWDVETVLASVAKTGRAVVVDAAWRSFGVAAEIAATIGEELFSDLRSPVRRVCLPDAPALAPRAYETDYYISSADIIQAVNTIPN